MWQIGSRGRLKLSQGDWDDALADSDAVLAAPSAPLARTWPHVVRGLIALRRGADATADLDDAWDLARHLAEPVRLLPVAAALVEQAWLTGDGRRPPRRVPCGCSPTRRNPAWSGPAASSRFGCVASTRGVTADDVAEPYRLELAGDHAAAAELWGTLGLPFEQALALLDTGRPDDRRAGLDALDRLGADGTAAWFRQHLRSNGVTSIPARRRDATVANAAGLTARQVEVLALLGEGLTNAEVGRRLYISPKTADHHVTAILTKLGVNTRGDAVVAAREQHLID